MMPELPAITENRVFCCGIVLLCSVNMHYSHDRPVARQEVRWKSQTEKDGKKEGGARESPAVAERARWAMLRKGTRPYGKSINRNIG